MPLDLNTVGRRLRDARENRGLTQEFAAQALGVSRTALIHIESGNRAVSMAQLGALADLYRVPVVTLLSEDTTEDVLVALRVTPSFRDHPSLQDQVTRCIEICREGVELTALLGKKRRTSAPFYELPEPGSSAEAIRQGSLVAEEERRRVGIGDAPLHMLSDFLTNQGIWGAQVGLPDEMSGLFLHHATVGMVILVNQQHARPRKRFSYMHEYAHALMDRDRRAIVSTHENARDRSETRANVFAAAFLMPETGVRSYLAALDKGLPSRQTMFVYGTTAGQPLEAQERTTPGSQKITYQDIASLARYFGVSYQAAVYRLQSLSIISASERDLLLAQVTKANDYLSMLKFAHFNDDEQEPPKAPHQELVSHIVYLAIEAYRRHLLSDEKLDTIAAKLAINQTTLRMLAEAAR